MKAKGKTILVVDDDPDMVEVLKTILGGEGYNVAVATNGSECLENVSRSKPDLILLDVMMTTETEGFTVAQKLKSDKATKDIPIFMLTAIEDRTGMEFARDVGESFLPVEEYVTKPIDPDDLIKRISKLIGA
jgi:CheY-like chemotaxis protein